MELTGTSNHKIDLKKSQRLNICKRKGEVNSPPYLYDAQCKWINMYAQCKWINMYAQCKWINMYAQCKWIKKTIDNPSARC